MGLKEYQRKRRFAETPEPAGAPGAPPGGRPRFVVQEHHARSRHWDLRLEMEGVLRSWAVPKGPSLDPADKRLAVLVEDHPLEYGEFEGVIPEGNYGAGTVLLWDRGTYACREGDPAEAFGRGKLTLDFAGTRLRGEFHFVRTKRNEGRDWLLFKGKDAYAEPGYSPAGVRSVATDRTIEEIAADRGDRWISGPADQSASGRARTGAGAKTPSGVTPTRRGTGAAPVERATEPAAAARPRRAAADPFPEPFRPMLAQTSDRPFDRAGWLFEVKWDGARALAFVRRRGAAREVALYSRSLRRLNAQFPEIVEALADLDVEEVVLDGEIAAPDERGTPSFARLQQRLHREAVEHAAWTSRRGAAGKGGGQAGRPAEVPVLYAAFDCLYLNGRDLRDRPFSERRAALESLSLPDGVIRGDVVEREGLALFEAARAHGLEGIIGKRAAGRYRSGERSADWIKVKIRHTVDAVVAGWTQGKGGRSVAFGALVLGQYDPETGALVHIGHAGGGFSDADLRHVRERLAPLVTPKCPFPKRPAIPGRVTWLQPEVVVEVEYGEWTPDGLLRFPVFLRVRDDVAPHDVRLTDPRRAAGETAEAAEETAKEARGTARAEKRTVKAAERAGTAPAAKGAAKAQAGAAQAPAPNRPSAALAGPPLPPGLAFTNLEKVFFPELGLTKTDVIAFYRRIAPHLLPHLADRPLTLRRFPNGIHGEDFFQKDVSDAPAFVRTERIWSDQGDRNITVVVGAGERSTKDTMGAGEATLAWLAQMGCIEMHAWYSRVTPIGGRGRSRPGTTFGGSEAAIEHSTLNYPDAVVFDVDPFLFPPGARPVRRHGELDPDYTRRGFEAARRAARWLGEALEGLGLRAFAKTSGKTGLHVFLPIHRRYTYTQTHAFAKTLCEWLTAQHPDELTTAWAVDARIGKVFLDYNQNVRGKTLASIYSLRPVPQATVSVPVTWDEMRAGFDPLDWTIATVFDRLARRGDLWANLPAAAQDLHLPADVRRGAGPQGGGAGPARSGARSTRNGARPTRSGAGSRRGAARLRRGGARRVRRPNR